MHILVFFLCLFWVYKFIVISYDPSVFVLLLFFIGAIALCDYLGIKTQAVSKFFLRCQVDYDRIYCYGLFWKSWKLQWSDICAYGVRGFSSPYRIGMIFFSSDFLEKKDNLETSIINNKRVVFQVNNEMVKTLCLYMPTDIKENIMKSVNRKKDCYYYRKTNKTGDG